jgi:hypothetical protein
MEEFDGCIRGHHISRTHWCPSIGKELLCKREEQNRHGPYAVAIAEKTRDAVVPYTYQYVQAQQGKVWLHETPTRVMTFR